ncbi:cytochrome P450 [Dactylosporangium sp. CA-233914]|uniref:cytochrome P450 n=1 Tax=Dactylosporangium sp. CA-233914 TaxID=3239934 RepID=UPI003D8E570E
MTSTQHSAPAYPFGAYERLDLHPRYGELRSTEPVARVAMPYGGECWLVTGYQEARVVFADPRFSRAATVGREDVARLTPQPLSARSLLGMDPPEHTRLRRLVAKAFTLRQVERLRPRAQEIVDGLLDTMEAGGQPADVASTLAWPLPVTVICELLGVPTDDRNRFLAWTEQSLSPSAAGVQDVAAALAELHKYMGELVDARSGEPGDDLLGELIKARDEGDRLTHPELVEFGVVLLVAGYRTTANQVGNMLFTLLSQPQLWQQLLDDRTLVPRAVDELLRHIPLTVGTTFPRVATEDVELGGKLIKAGDTVAVHHHVASRDESVFDRGDEIDLGRAHNPHLAFGHGPHHCVGASLARMELGVALDTLLRRFPGLRLAVPADEVPWQEGLIRGVKQLPVRW